MLWYNKITGELQSNPPYSGWLHQEKVVELYSDWQQVPDDFIPPAFQPSLEQQLSGLNAKFEPQFRANNEAYLLALRNDDRELMDELNQEKEDLVDEYARRKGEILSGN